MVKKVSIIIPSLDRNKVLISTLRDLLKQNYPNFEIIVVDQTESPNRKFLDFIESHKSKINYINEKKKSSPHARNVGVKLATGEIVLFLDDDVEIKNQKFIQYHVRNFTDLKVGLVGGRVMHLTDGKVPAKLEVGRLKFWGLKEVTHFNATKKSEIDHAAGGNFSVYKKIYGQVGGFAEIYKGNAHMEETDFSLRVKRAGYKLIFEPKAVLLHLQHNQGGNRTRDIYEFRYWLVHNSTVFYLKHYPRVLFPLFFGNKFFWTVTSSLKRRDMKMFRTMFGAIIDGYKYYKKISGNHQVRSS